MRPVSLSSVAGAYYQGSLHHQDLPGERLLFSITSRRTRNDPDGVEFYVVDPAAGDPQKVMVVKAKRALVEWHFAGGQLALVRKRLGARAVASIDIYDLAVAERAAHQLDATSHGR
jgi:hypothetical protein